MPKAPQEDESCQHCVFCGPPPKRERVLFPDGNTLMFSGVCENPDSLLKGKPLVNNHVAIVNAMHHKLKNFRDAKCFLRKKVVPAPAI